MTRLLCILLLGVIYVSTYTSEAKSMSKDLHRLIRLFEDVEFDEREERKDDGSLEIDEIIIKAGQGRVLDERAFKKTNVGARTSDDKEEDLGQSIDDIIINAGKTRGLLKRDLDLSETPMEDGSVLMEADMLMTPEQVEEDKQLKRHLKMGLEKRKGIKSTDHRWTNKILPYVIAPNTFSDVDMVEINKAISDYNEYTCLTVQPRTNEANYVTLSDGSGCSSNVGMISIGSQRVSLASGCRNKRTIIHELGHTLGFTHEQNRYDRDEYLTIDLSSVPEEWQRNFEKYTRSTMNIHGVAYDYGSVMHYGDTDFSSADPKEITMVTKDPNYQKKIGHSKGLSFADVKTLNLMYECGGHCTGSCPDDGYFDANCECQCNSEADVFRSGTVPINICGNIQGLCSQNPCLNGGSCSNADGTCTCPEGFGGELCDTVVQIDCADKLTDCSRYSLYWCQSNAILHGSTTWKDFMSDHCSYSCGWCGPCGQNPCINGGSCSSTDGTCTCPEGMSGELCDTIARSCTSTCLAGEYQSGSCTGTEASDVIYCTACTSTCSAGEYLDGSCSGRGNSDVVSCTACTSTCSAGEYLDGSCSGTDISDVVSCTACTSTCSAGEYLDGSCSGMDTSDVSCRACTSTCSAGEYLDGSCSGTDTSDVVSCTACTSTCSAGEYLDGSCSGTDSSDVVSCTACTSTCSAGEYLDGSCSGTDTSDVVSCKDCVDKKTYCSYLPIEQCQSTTWKNWMSDNCRSFCGYCE